MVLQMRPNTGGVPYAPARDLVYLFPDICRNVAVRLEEERFKPLHAWLREQGVSLDDLGEVCRVYIEFVSTVHLCPGESVDDALTRVGWFELKPEARIAYIFYIGAQVTGVFYQGLRDVVLEGEDTLEDVKRLSGLADRVQLSLTRPKWKRLLCRWGRQCRKTLRKWILGDKD